MIREEKKIHKCIYGFIWILYFSFLFIRGNISWTIARLFPVFIASVVIIDRLRDSKRRKNLIAITFQFEEFGAILWYIPYAIWVFISRYWSLPSGIVNTGLGIELISISFMLISMDVFVRDKDDVYTIIKGYCIGSFLYAFVVLVTSPVSSYGSLNFGKATNMQRNSTGYVLFFATIFCFMLLEYTKKKLYILVAVTCFITSLLTGSRKIIFAYGVAFLIWLFSKNDVKENLKLIGKMILLLAILFPLVYQIPFIKETFGERLLAVVDESIYDSSIFYRNLAKETAIKLFKEQPIIGNGWNAVKMTFHYKDVAIYAHNNYLETAADFGIIGIFLYYWKSFGALFKSGMKVRRSKYCMMQTVILVCILMLDWGQVTFWYRFMVCTLGIIYKYNDFVVSKEDIDL